LGVEAATRPTTEETLLPDISVRRYRPAFTIASRFSRPVGSEAD